MAEIVLVASKVDPAGSTLAKALVEKFGFEETGEVFDDNPVRVIGNIKLVLSSKDIIHTDHLDAKFNPEVYVFLSRHKSDSGIPTLTAHFPGNLTQETKAGGNPRELAHTLPSLMKEYLMGLWGVREETGGYGIAAEPTHHGPSSLSKPVLFAELGSTEKEWTDDRAAEIVCRVVLKTLSSPRRRFKTALAFGGPHYSDKFTKIVLESDYALATTVPKYALPHIDKSIMDQMLKKSVESVKYALLDWKGLSQHRDRIIELAQETGLEVVRV